MLPKLILVFFFFYSSYQSEAGIWNRWSSISMRRFFGHIYPWSSTMVSKVSAIPMLCLVIIFLLFHYLNFQTLHQGPLGMMMICLHQSPAGTCLRPLVMRTKAVLGTDPGKQIMVTDWRRTAVTVGCLREVTDGTNLTISESLRS